MPQPEQNSVLPAVIERIQALAETHVWLPDGELLLRLGVAALAGAMLGAERELRDKPAGLRTLILISVGAALFTALSIEIGNDPARVAAQVASGVGFLGAGVIMRDNGRLSGITTAAMIWVTAALGMAAGAGRLGLCLAGTGCGLVTLFLLLPLEQRMDLLRDTRLYRLELVDGVEADPGFEDAMRAAGLSLRGARRGRAQGRLWMEWNATGKPSCHQQVQELLMNDPRIHDLVC